METSIPQSEVLEQTAEKLPQTGDDDAPQGSQIPSEDSVSEPTAHGEPLLTWRHHLPAFAPLAGFLLCLAIARPLLRPEIPPVSLVVPASAILVAIYFLSDWLTVGFRSNHPRQTNGVVWSRQALRNGLLCNALYTFLTHGTYSLGDFVGGMVLNYLGSIAQEYTGNVSNRDSWQQLKDAFKTFLVLVVLKLFTPSILSLDSIITFLLGAWQRGCFNASIDFTMDFVAAAHPTRKGRFQALGLVMLQGVLCIFLLLFTPFFRNAIPGTNCGSRWTNLMFTYLCHAAIDTSDPLTLHKQLACSYEVVGNSTVQDAQEQLQASAEYVANTCGGAMPDYLQLRACQSSLMVERYGLTCAANVVPYVEAAARCAQGTAFEDVFADLLGLTKAVRGRKTKTAGFELDEQSQKFLMGALPRGTLDKHGTSPKRKEVLMARYM